MAAAPQLDVEAGRSRLLTSMQIRLELLRDRNGLQGAYEGYQAFAQGEKGKRLRDLKRNP